MAAGGSQAIPAGAQDFTRVVEVPVVEEVMRTVPKKETVEVEKRFQRTQTEIVERVVEVPQVRRVKKIVEVPTFQEVVKTVKRKEVVAVPKEVIKYVTRKEPRVVEVEKQVKGEVVEVPKIIDVIKEVIVPRYTKIEVPTVVAQTVVPVVIDPDVPEQISAFIYEPRIQTVDIYIPKPMDRSMVCEGKVGEELREVEIPAPQYNHILRNLNSDIIAQEKVVYRDLPLRAEADGSVHFLNACSESRPLDSDDPGAGGGSFPGTGALSPRSIASPRKYRSIPSSGLPLMHLAGPTTEGPAPRTGAGSAGSLSSTSPSFSRNAQPLHKAPTADLMLSA